MGTVLDSIDDDLAAWIEAQPVFFVATAPCGPDGHVNLSPKGYDTLRVLGPDSVAYVDLTGSGVETIAHLRENGRITLMLCAFEGPPKIVRLYGTGEVVLPGDPDWDDLWSRFPARSGARAIIRTRVERLSSSCGFAVSVHEPGRRARDPRPVERPQEPRRARGLPGREERRQHRRPPRPPLKRGSPAAAGLAV